MGLLLILPAAASSFSDHVTTSDANNPQENLTIGYLLPGVYGPYSPEHDFTMSFRFAFYQGQGHRLVFEPLPGTIPLSGGGTSTFQYSVDILDARIASPTAFTMTIPAAYLSWYLNVRMTNYYAYDYSTRSFHDKEYVNNVIYLFPPKAETIALPTDSGTTFGSKIYSRCVIEGNGKFTRVARTYQGTGLVSSFGADKEGRIALETIGIKDVSYHCGLDFSCQKASFRFYDHLHDFAIGDYYPSKGYREIPMETYLGDDGFNHFRLAKTYIVNLLTREMREGTILQENEAFTREFCLPRSTDYGETSFSCGLLIEGAGDLALTTMDYRFALRPYSALVGGCDEASYCVGVA